MTYVRKYTKEQLIALARKRGIHPPEDATDDELKVVQRRLSAERGWIGPPQPVVEWHMPAWVKTGGGHFLSHLSSARRPREEPWPAQGSEPK